LYDNLIAENYPVKLIGIAKDSQINYSSNWTNDNDASVCADTSPYSTWNGWNASQRDLFLLDKDGNIIFQQNITSGLPQNLDSLIINLANLSIIDEPFPIKFNLYNAYPNPFNPITTLRYDLPEDELVTITIYDMMGRKVKTVINGKQTSGHKSVKWNSNNDNEIPVSAGLYIYTMEAGKFRQTKKIVLLR
tara:strand:+ start:158 stop:730 length:573 start_codon:yes stop_codon:yes gene_type:complete